MLQQEEIIRRLKAHIAVKEHIIGVAVGSGITAKYAALGGADFLLALSAGRYRIMGRGSFASYFCYANSNEVVMDFGQHQLLPSIQDTPVIFGLFASDPLIDLPLYVKKIKNTGFSGIVNFPTIALIDGQFRTALEEEGISYAREVEAIRLAHECNLFTIAFVTDENETRQMLDAGTDVLCVHLGLTKGGFLGAKNCLSLEAARKICSRLFELCHKIRPNVIKMIYAGPANTPLDMQYLYQNTVCQGYIGGSTFDRIPLENAILNTMKEFREYGSPDSGDTPAKTLRKTWTAHDYVSFVRQYVEKNYRQEIQIRDLASDAHISQSHLSALFKREMGCNFTEYLVRFRINQAKKLLVSGDFSCKEAALQSGYSDYAHFSKIFKKYVGKTPKEFKKTCTKTSPFDTSA